MPRTFDDLVAEADSVSVDGWDFSWLDGRATEERPSWGYQRLISRHFAKVSAALDLQTGGGEVLAGAGPFPPTMAAVESWPPNIPLATKRLHPLGVVVVGLGTSSAAPVRRRRLRPGDQPASAHRVVVRDRPGVAPRWHLPGAAHRPRDGGRVGRVLHRAATRGMGPRHPDNESAAGAGGRAGGRRYALRATTPGVLRHWCRCVLPAQGDLDRAGLHGASATAIGCASFMTASSRRPLRRARHAGPRRGPQAKCRLGPDATRHSTT